MLDPDPHCPAALAGAEILIGEPADLDALLALSARCEVITFDHERIPLAHLRTLEAGGATLRPRPATAELAFDKSVARRRWSAAGIPIPEFTEVGGVPDIEEFARTAGWPVVVKSARGGYDGRGVAVVDDPADAHRAVEMLGPGLIAERFVRFDSELSVLIARGPDGEMATYPPVSTVQEDGMCVEVIYPASIGDAVRTRAIDVARDVAADADLVGIMAVEMFVVGDRVLVNEVATRPHNTGHLTIEANETSQFEQHLRCVLDLPLGTTSARSAVAVMRNVVGDADGSDPTLGLDRALAVDGAHVHLYGKQPRPGRKLGHVTTLGDDIEMVRATAVQAVDALHACAVNVGANA